MKAEGDGYPAHQPEEAPNDQPVSPGLLIETVQRHPVMIACTCALVLTGAYIYLERITPLYTSTARVYVEKAEDQVMTGSDNYLYTQAAVLKSSAVLETALRLLEVKPLQTFTDCDDPLSALQSRVTTQVGKMDGIINISFKAPYPEEAADVVNAIVDGYVDFHVRGKRAATVALLDILQEERRHRSAEVALKHQHMVEFKRENQSLVFGSDQGDNIVTRRMERLLTQLAEAQLATIQAKFISERAQTVAEDPIALRQFLETWRGSSIESAAMNEAATLEAELRRREREKDDILLELKLTHPAVVALDRNMERIRRRIRELHQQFAQRQLNRVHGEYLAAKQREDELTRQYETQRQEALLLDDLQAQYDMLQKEYELSKRVLDALDERINPLRVTKEVGGLTVTVLERAQVAGAPSEPKKARIMAVALFLGLSAGMGLALVRELSDRRIRSSQEIAALLRIPVLGAVPAMRSFLRSGTLRAQMVRVCGTSPEAEAFRRLRTHFLFGLLKEKAKTIVVTSPVSGEGKSLLVSNLAIAMAQAGQRVLIVDADCHTPSQHKIFKKDRQAKGLSMVLAGQMTVEEAIEPTRTSNLDILTCGPAVSNSTEILAGGRWRWLVTTLAGQYDRVLIDSPPLLPVTDAPILAAQCDGVVLVLRAHVSTRKDSAEACGELTAVGACILGVVVNGVPRGRRRYGYGYSRYGRHSDRPIGVIRNEKSEPRNKESSPFELSSQKRN